MAEQKSRKAANSMDDLDASGDVDFKEIDGFSPGQTLWIGSLSAADIVEWTETEDPDAKRYAGARLVCKALVSTAETGRVRYAAGATKEQASENIRKLLRRNHKELNRIVQQVLEHNSLAAGQAATEKKD